MKILNEKNEDRKTIARLSQALDTLATNGNLWTIPAGYNRGEKLPLTESGRDVVTQLVRFLCEHDIRPLSVMQDTSGTTVDMKILTISSFDLNELLTAVRKWREKHMSRRQRKASLKFRLSISGNEDPSPKLGLRLF